MPGVPCDHQFFIGLHHFYLHPAHFCRDDLQLHAIVALIDFNSGSRSPERAPITSPPAGLRSIVVSTLIPLTTAAILAPVELKQLYKRAYNLRF